MSEPAEVFFPVIAPFCIALDINALSAVVSTATLIDVNVAPVPLDTVISGPWVVLSAATGLAILTHLEPSL